MAFKYRPRSVESIEKRASESNNEYEGYIRDEYRTFSPKKGDHSVRILPCSWENEDNNYYVDVWVHYSVGPTKAAVICLQRMRKGKCPICEALVLAERRGDEEEIRNLRASHRALVWMINRRDEEAGVLAWGMPFTLDRDFNKQAKDKQTGKYRIYDDPEQGYDLYFDKLDATPWYAGVQIASRPTSVDQRFLDYIEKNPLPDILLWRTYDEVKALYEGAAATEKPARADTRESERAARNGHDDDPPSDVEQRRARDDMRPEPRPASDDTRQSVVSSGENEPALPLGETPSAAARAAGLRARFSKR